MIESNYNRGHFIKHKTDQVKVLETSRQKLLGMEFNINLEFQDYSRSLHSANKLKKLISRFI